MTLVIFSLIGILLLAVPGYFLRKKGMVGEDGLTVMSNLLLYVTTPMLIFINFQAMPYTKEMGIDLLYMAAISFFIFTTLSIILVVFFKPQNRGDFSKLFCFGITFANTGYMAIPFLEAIYPGNSEIIMYSAVIISIFNIFIWTVGIFYVTGDKSSISLKKGLTNPATIALLISIPLFVLNIRISDFSESIYTSLSSFSTMNTPLSMLVLGIKLADSNFVRLLKNKKLYIISAFKLLIVPIITFLVVILPLKSVVNDDILRVLMITTMMPGAAATPVMFEKFGGDGLAGAEYFLLSTCLSVLTIPIMMELVYLI